MNRRALLALLPLPWLANVLPERTREGVNMLDPDGAMREACRRIWEAGPGPKYIYVDVSERMVQTMEEIALRYGHPVLAEPWEPEWEDRG